ncbi:MAG: energy transducer TonB [Magnetococcales bacterium]|nr:energy transducer TonB [Magnetococcales bacterium]
MRFDFFTGFTYWQKAVALGVAISIHGFVLSLNLNQNTSHLPEPIQIVSLEMVQLPIIQSVPSLISGMPVSRPKETQPIIKPQAVAVAKVAHAIPDLPKPVVQPKRKIVSKPKPVPPKILLKPEIKALPASSDQEMLEETIEYSASIPEKTTKNALTSGLNQNIDSKSVPPSGAIGSMGNPAPRYPNSARRRGYEGSVVLSVEVNPKGLPVGISVHKSSGYSVLDRAAIKTVWKWHFKPAEKQGRAVQGFVEIPIRFQLVDR